MAIPIHVRARRGVPTTAEDYASKTLLSTLAPFASHVLRATVALEDGGLVRGRRITWCLVRVLLRGRDEVVVEERGAAARAAVDTATDALERALVSAFGAPKAAPKKTVRRRATPPKRRTARQNVKGRATDEAYALEASATGRPSRKSTRGSKNRIKPASNLTRRTQRAERSPENRAAKARARDAHPRGSRSSRSSRGSD